MRGFHLQPMVRNMSTATNDDSREEGSAQDNDQQSELSDRAPPRKPVVLGVPSFTRDMQVCVLWLAGGKGVGQVLPFWQNLQVNLFCEVR